MRSPVSSCVAALGYMLVGTLVLLALLSTAIRLLFPISDLYRTQVETWISELIGAQVRVESINAHISGLSPTVFLGGVTLHSPDDGSIIARFDSIDLGLDAVQSLSHGSLILRQLGVGGASLTILRKKDGSLTVSGLAGSAAPAPGGDALGQWLFAQGDLKLYDSTLIWRDESRGNNIALRDVTIRFENLGDLHRLEGKAALSQEMGRELNFAADLQGRFEENLKLRGDVYLHFSGLHIEHLLEEAQLDDLDLRGGQVDLKLWARWEENRWQRLNGQFGGDHLLYRHGEHTMQLDGLGSKFNWERTDEGWQLDLAGLIVRHDGVTWRPIRSRIESAADGYHLLIDRLDMEQVHQLFATLPLPEPRWQELAAALAPQGSLSHLRFFFGGADELAVQGKFQNVSIVGGDYWPTLSGINGLLSWQGEQGEIMLHSDNFVLDDPRLFRQPLRLQLDARVRGALTTAGWMVESDALEVANADLRARAFMRVGAPAGGIPHLDIEADLDAMDATRVGPYLPIALMGDELTRLLGDALGDGQVTRGRLLLHRYLSDGAYQEIDGPFRLVFDVEGVQFRYHDDWPELEAITGEVAIEHTSLAIKASSATMRKSPIHHATAYIADFEAPLLEVEAQAEVEGTDAIYLLSQTPLADVGGKVAADMVIEDHLGLELHLSLPLAEDTTQPPVAAGKVTFNGNQISVVNGITPQKIEGELRFTDSNFSATDLKAVLFGHPATLDITTEEQVATRIQMEGGVNMRALERAFGWPGLDHLEGDSRWQAQLELPHSSGEGAHLEINSDLQGITSRLPDLPKEPDSAHPLRILIGLSDSREGQLDIDLAEIISMRIDQDGLGGPLKRLALLFGGGELDLYAADSIQIRGTLEHLALADWLSIIGNTETENNLKLPIDIQMDRLVIDQLPEDEEEERTAPPPSGPWPSLHVRVGEMRVAGALLGQVALNTKPSAQGHTISQIEIDNGVMRVRGDGGYLNTPHNRSWLNLRLDSDDMGKMMESLGFSSTIESGKGWAEGSFGWPGSPQALKLGNLNGTLKLELKEGTITEANSDTGRLLGLFSLSQLPQRLLLDFSDIFGSGLKFNSIKGDFEITDGDAWTENLRMESAVARMLVTGRTGLGSRDFDQHLYVNPKISQSLPLAGALAWGPQAAAALLLFQNVFKGAIDDNTMFHYVVHGSWEEPVIWRDDT